MKPENFFYIKISDREIIEYYGQIYDNVKHLSKYVKNLRLRYESEK